MAREPSTTVLRPSDAPPNRLRAWFDAFAQRFPFLGLALAILASNVAGSFFSFFYNTLLIIAELTPAQVDAFWNVAAPIYNVLAYPIGFGYYVFLAWPMSRCLSKLRRGETVEPGYLQFCQRRLVNSPIVQLTVNFSLVAPGAVYFPAVIMAVGGAENAVFLWLQFLVSFAISAVFTTVQTFFIMQAYLTGYLYPDYFQDTRPEDVPGVIAIPFTVRLGMLWAAVALMPIIAILAVACSFPTKPADYAGYFAFAAGLVGVSAVSGGGIFWLVGRDLQRWIHLQTDATGQVAHGNFNIRIEHPRPDEWGQLTNRFNDMADSLAQAWESHETLGQLVSPQVRDQILSRMTGFEVQLQEITVLFVDIRGFTARSAGAAPEKIGRLLNRFLTLALQSIEEKGGYVNKFLGDGVMALFGAMRPQEDHAELAVASAVELLNRLTGLNRELAEQGEAPLVVGIGIHTGPALVGCFGASVHGAMRREFTAIGETVNLCQRLEQLTKKCGGPILLSDDTRRRLREAWPIVSIGPQLLPGAPQPMLVYKAGSA